MMTLCGLHQRKLAHLILFTMNFKQDGEKNSDGPKKNISAFFVYLELNECHVFFAFQSTSCINIYIEGKKNCFAPSNGVAKRYSQSNLRTHRLLYKRRVDSNLHIVWQMM